MSDAWDTARRRGRQRETAAGSGRHWDNDGSRPRVRSSSSRLQRTERGRQRLVIRCRGRCVAVVLQGGAPGQMELACEAIPTTQAAKMPPSPDTGWAFTLLELDSAAKFVVGCRCHAHRHDLSPEKLRAEAWQGQPGRPRTVSVSTVAVHNGM